MPERRGGTVRRIVHAPETLMQIMEPGLQATCCVAAMLQSTKNRSAAATLIAVLAGTAAAPVWAQDAQLAPPPVVTTTSQPPAPAAAAPVVAPPPIARTVTPTVAPSTDAGSRTTVNAAAVAQAEAERPAAQAAPAPTRRAAPAPRIAAAPAAERTAPPPAAEAAPVAVAPVAAASEAAPAAPQVASDPANVAAATAPAEPAPVAEANPNGGIPLSWLLGGLGALALLGLAAAMVLRRRGEAEYQKVHAHPELADTAAPVAAAPRPAFVAPVAPLATGPVRTADGHLVGRHEALAMQGPSADNPFLTVKNRLKRARFYDRQERLAGVPQRPASMPFDARPAAAPAREAGLVSANVRPSRERSFGWPGAPRPAMG